jgi:phosphonate transport system substrate-binding protein
MLRSLLVLVLMAVSLEAAAGPQLVRFGVTPVILQDDYDAMLAFRQYVEKKTGWVVELVPRSSYGQTMEMVKRRELDFAWVSAAPYVYLRHAAKIRIVAMPLLKGRPTFQSYLIVSSDDHDTQSILNLRGRIFAYADPYSHTGYVVPRYQLWRAGQDPRNFFAKTFFAAGHKNVVRAVASGLADGGSVDSFVWDALARVDPGLVAKTRIAARSVEFGSPPIVAAPDVATRDVEKLRRVMIGMADDPSATEVLRKIQVEGFVTGDPAAFAEVEAMMRAIGDL